MKTISRAFSWFMERLPEALLGFFVLSLLPLAYLVLQGGWRALQTLAQSPSEYVHSLLNEWPVTVATGACLVGVVIVMYVLARSWTPVWAVARKMIIEAIHRKVVIVLLLFFVVLMPSLPFLLQTQGSVKSQVQLVLLYSLCLALVLLSLLGIFLTTSSICVEVERKHVQITDTKPLRRWQFLLGKWFGTVVLVTAVMCLMTAATYGLVRYLGRPVDYSKLTPLEVRQARKDEEGLAQEVFVARKAIPTMLPGDSPEIEKKLKEWHEAFTEKFDMPIAVYSKRQDLIRQNQRRSQTALPGGEVRWRFSGLSPARKGPIQVRFKLYGHRFSGAAGLFVPARIKVVEGAREGGKGEERLVPAGPAVLSPPGGWLGGAFHEFTVKDAPIGEDGTFYLVFRNLERNAVTFDIKSPIEVLQKEGGFLANYYRALLVLVIHVALLAALGLMAGSLFSFPVASLVVFCLFVGGLLGPWFEENFVKINVYAELTPGLSVYLDKAWRLFASILVSLMPNFGHYSPLGDVVNGRMVSMGDVSLASAVLLFLKGGVALLIGIYFYTRRELARIIV
ncbi:MAG: hypothetical protein J7M08_10120 [Planctomycetes bacterium]|nr:hypothetical protein [Planctomycetota bacterium]